MIQVSLRRAQASLTPYRLGCCAACFVTKQVVGDADRGDDIYLGWISPLSDNCWTRQPRQQSAISCRDRTTDTPRPKIFEFTQAQNLRRVQRNPAQHHRESGFGAVTASHEASRSKDAEG